MSDLVISAAASLGPLSIDVFGPGGSHQNSSPILLSSSVSSATLSDLSGGTYAIVATRPNGEALVHEVNVGRGKTEAHIDVPDSEQTPLLREEIRRGFVPVAGMYQSSSLPAGLGMRYATSVSGVARTTLRSIAANNAIQAEAGPSLRGPQPKGVPKDEESSYQLCCWEFDGEWSPLKLLAPSETTPHYVSVNTSYFGLATAYGLLDKDRYGPIVVVPRFQGGVSLTFLAEGLAARQSADRAQNPSAVRVPVAIAVPRNSRSADLLAALNAPSLPNALDLWQQEVGRTGDTTELALDLLAQKTDDLAAATLGAHFLSRFDPTAAPVRWLSNLMSLMPDYADPPVLLAWRFINGASEDLADPSRLQLLFEQASNKQCCLFSRTRRLLTQGNRLYNRRRRSIDPNDGAIASPEIFLNFAADAGGLDAFWGTEPRRPGRPSPSRAAVDMGPDTSLILRGGEFVPY